MVNPSPAWPAAGDSTDYPAAAGDPHSYRPHEPQSPALAGPRERTRRHDRTSQTEHTDVHKRALAHVASGGHTISPVRSWGSISTTASAARAFAESVRRAAR